MNEYRMIKELAEMIIWYQEIQKDYDDLITEIHNISGEEIIIKLINDKYIIKER